MLLILEIEKLFPIIRMHLTKEKYQEFMQKPCEELSAYHFSLGMWIRNHLLCGNLYHIFVESGMTEKDDMSRLIILLFYLSEKKE